MSSLSLLIPMFAETFLGHVDDTHSERRMSGGAEAWRAVKPASSREDAAGVDTLDATVDTSAAKGKRGGPRIRPEDSWHPPPCWHPRFHKRWGRLVACVRVVGRGAMEAERLVPR